MRPRGRLSNSKSASTWWLQRIDVGGNRPSPRVKAREGGPVTLGKASQPTNCGREVPDVLAFVSIGFRLIGCFAFYPMTTQTHQYLTFSDSHEEQMTILAVSRELLR
jgi:hypothetical protein